MTSKSSEFAASLLSAKAVRERTARLFALGEAGRLEHFALDLDALPALARRVAEVTRAAYPMLDVPFHARWRHFVFRGEDRWSQLAASKTWASPAARARAAFDLAVTSVLLDAGAGPHWRYRDRATGERVERSEGLALASFDMFTAGAFSADPDDPLRADAERLRSLSVGALAQGFQVFDDNPLEGLEGRVTLLNALGRALARPGQLYDILTSGGGSVAATDILAAVLHHLGGIWPSRLSHDGIPLGDCWRHPSLDDGTAGSNLVPFHKLSQWLSYSLIEPMQAAGIVVVAIDGLTGLPEYRNGGLFLDGGVIVAKDPTIFRQPHEPGSTVVVEWRALTVQLLDRIAPLVRAELGVAEADFPLAKVLEGGTWATGRLLARERRTDGGPPLAIVSDGTVF